MENESKRDLLLQEAETVSKNSISHGGKFDFYIGNALRIADMEHTMTIKAAFPEYWKQYLKW